MTKLLYRILALALLLAPLPALAQTGQSNCNGVLANCTPSFTQNGIQSFVKTYKASILGVTPAATASDVLQIVGSSTRTVRITKIVVSGVANSAGAVPVYVMRRSAVDSGGASTLLPALTRDTQNAAAGAVVNYFTGNPTLGATVGTLDQCRLFLQVATAGAPDVCAFTYGVNDDQLTVLRGASDVLAISLSNQTIPSGGLIDLDVEWTEE